MVYGGSKRREDDNLRRSLLLNWQTRTLLISQRGKVAVSDSGEGNKYKEENHR